MWTDRLDYVRRLWRTLETRGLDAMLALVPEDVTWEPLRGDGRVLRGHDELRAYQAERARDGRSQVTTVYSFEEVGSCVLVTGSLRDVEPYGFRESQPAWVYFFDGDRLVRAVGFRTDAEARRAIAAGHAS